MLSFKTSLNLLKMQTYHIGNFKVKLEAYTIIVIVGVIESVSFKLRMLHDTSMIRS